MRVFLFMLLLSCSTPKVPSTSVYHIHYEDCHGVQKIDQVRLPLGDYELLICSGGGEFWLSYLDGSPVRIKGCVRYLIDYKKL